MQCQRPTAGGGLAPGTLGSERSRRPGPELGKASHLPTLLRYSRVGSYQILTVYAEPPTDTTMARKRMRGPRRVDPPGPVDSPAPRESLLGPASRLPTLMQTAPAPTCEGCEGVPRGVAHKGHGAT